MSLSSSPALGVSSVRERKVDYSSKWTLLIKMQMLAMRSQEANDPDYNPNDANEEGIEERRGWMKRIETWLLQDFSFYIDIGLFMSLNQPSNHTQSKGLTDWGV
jgi:hypothetical protein